MSLVLTCFYFVDLRPFHVHCHSGTTKKFVQTNILKLLDAAFGYHIRTLER